MGFSGPEPKTAKEFAEAAKEKEKERLQRRTVQTYTSSESHADDVTLFLNRARSLLLPPAALLPLPLHSGLLLPTCLSPTPAAVPPEPPSANVQTAARVRSWRSSRRSTAISSPSAARTTAP